MITLKMEFDVDAEISVERRDASKEVPSILHPSLPVKVTEKQITISIVDGPKVSKIEMSEDEAHDLIRLIKTACRLKTDA